MTLEEGILEGISNHIRILEVKIIEVDMEEITEMIIRKEAEVGLGIDNILIIEGAKEGTVDLDQVQEPVLIEIKLN